MKRTARVFPIVILLVSGLISGAALTEMSAHEPTSASPKAAPVPLLSAHQLRLLSGGFAPVVADIYWIDTVSTAGNSLEGDQGAERLYHLLERVVTLDPRFESAYQYGNLLLSIRSGRPDLGDRLLHLAERSFPDKWEYPFYLGFNRFYYDSDFLTAADHFERAGRLPGAPPYLAALAVRFRDQRHNVEMAQALLRRLIRVSDDPVIKQRLTERLAELEGKS